MFTAPSAAALQLQLVPAGRRLYFAAVPDHYACVYRRGLDEPWECVASHVGSPYLDCTPLLPSATPHEYMVRFLDAGGTVTATTPPVQLHPMGLPKRTGWLELP